MTEMAELATRIAELQRVVTAQQSDIQSMRQQQGQQEQAPRRAAFQQPDTRLGQPPVFVGDESAFDSWSFKQKAEKAEEAEKAEKAENCLLYTSDAADE